MEEVKADEFFEAPHLIIARSQEDAQAIVNGAAVLAVIGSDHDGGLPTDVFEEGLTSEESSVCNPEGGALESDYLASR